jgi:hypothetical protein
VLVYAPNMIYGPKHGMFIARLLPDNEWDADEYGLCNPTHWQPLPEPPR